MPKTETSTGEEPITVAEPVAPPEYAYAPRKRTIERSGGVSVPYGERYPQIRGGLCEFCGVIDNTQPSTVQYLLCPHFKDIGEIRCSYCDASRNPEEVMYKAIMNVHGHPDNPTKLVVVCNDYKCSQKHEARFKLSM